MVLLVVLVGSACQPSLVSQRTELGPMGKPASVVGRDGGASARIGSTETWVFGDTLLNRRSCDGFAMRSSTAALGDASNVTALTDQLDACGTPGELFTFRADEPFVDGCHRTALWPTSIVPSETGTTGLVYLTNGRYEGCGLVPSIYKGIEIATIPAGGYRATRQAGVLFGPTEPEFSHAVVVGSYLYVYAEIMPNSSSRRYLLARVPRSGSQPFSRAAYRFYAGVDAAGVPVWSTDVTRSAFVPLGGTGNDAYAGVSGVSVTWNPHLGRYLMVHTEFARQDVLLRTATRPEGPWSAPTHVDVVDATGGLGFIYNAQEHLSYRSADGKTLYVTYSSDALRMVRIVLN